MKDSATRSRRSPSRTLPAWTSLALAYSAAAAPLSARPSTPAQQGGAQSPAPPAALAFEGVTVVDVTDGRLLPNQTVVVAGNRVQAVGPDGKVRRPAGTQVVDGRGKYLIPGLWDMHTHVDRQANRWYPLYIANGVTGIRDMAQRFPNGADSLRVWQREVMAGTRVGPRVFGPSVDLTNGPGPRVGSPDDAGRIMDSLKAVGTVFAKYHEFKADPNHFFAIMREARRVGLPVVGHVPREVTSVEAADSGLRSVEHTSENHQCWPEWPKPLPDDSTAMARCAPVAQAYIRNGTWVVPTLIIAYHAVQRERLREAQKVVGMLHRLGVRKFLAGSDLVTQPKGAPLLHELVYLAKAGLTPLEVLQTATLNPAKFFEATDSLGTIAPGKLADLVLLDANPLEDIGNVKRIRAVVANGRYFDRATLDTLDPRAAAILELFAKLDADNPDPQPGAGSAAGATP